MMRVTTTGRLVVKCCLLLGFLSACLTLATGTAADAARRPNVIVILLDNVGQEWFGCYGSEEECTPRIDQLARTGVLATHCYAPPVCGPSRTVFLTGRYPFRTGFTIHHDAALYAGGGLDPRRELIFPRLFHQAGYATAIAGKWQINHLYEEPDVLARHGFAEQLVWPGSLDTDKVSSAEMEQFQDAVRRESVEETVGFIQRIESRYWDPVFLRNGRREAHPGKFGPDVAQRFALDFIARHRDQPFLLYYPMVLTHGQTFTQPVVPTPLTREAERSQHEMFGDMLRYGDKLIGELIDKLDELGLRDDTYVVVASDNGTEKRFSARRNGRVVQGGLYTLTEAGGDVVLLVNSPRRIPGGRTIPLTDFSDIYPTVCELAGIGLPSDVTLDGHSLADFLHGERGSTPPRKWIFNQQHTTRVVRGPQYKLYSDGRLFDANADPDEQHDLQDTADPDVKAARAELQDVLSRLPPDSPPPFPLRSQYGFNLRRQQPSFRIQLDTISRGYDGQTCWVHPRAGTIPGTTPTVVLTMQKLLLSGSDVFFALNEMRTDDLGGSWNGPIEHANTLGRREEPEQVVVAACDFTPKWHPSSGTLLGTGHTVRYRNDRVIAERDRETAYSTYDPAARQWTPWTTLDMPDRVKFQNAGAGSVQRVDLPDGDILLPIYFKHKEQKQYRTTVVRCSFDGRKLAYREHGTEMTVDIGRGLYEPSLTRFAGRYYLTLRNDEAGYVTASDDGLNFEIPRKWQWDDGTELGNYNTQQHWVTHQDGLFLVYTRKGANNDHVFRHRAPLFIAQIDPRALHVLKRTERVLVPERGARLGNFAVTNVNERETWVTVAEWMQKWGPDHVIRPDNAYGADNSVYVARILWDQPNEIWNQN